MNSTQTGASLLLDPAYPALKQHLIESTGLAYYANKDSDLAARIGARMAQLNLAGCSEYLAMLRDREDGEVERHALIGLLTIGETYFFRHSEQFDAIRDVALPDILQRNRDRRTLRIWSAGCATGAEPYTIAILLKQYFGAQLEGWDVRILGTDLNQSFLARAERGEFDERALRSTPDEVKRAWFTPAGPFWRVLPFAKDWLSFQYHNLVEHPYPSIVHGIAALDLILCRNVMIYFDIDVIQSILGRFHECLVDGGWLAVGHAESNTEWFGAYRTVNLPGATLYQKTSDRRPVTIPFVSAAPAPAVQPASFVPPTWTPPDLPSVPAAGRPFPAPAPIVAAPPAAAASDRGVALIRRLADEGKWPEAERACEQALLADSLNAEVHFYQALVLEQMRRPADAERALRRAIYLDRGFVLAHYHLGLLLRTMKQRDEAIRSLRNVQALLARMASDDAIADADGLTVADLRQLADLHLGLLAS